MKKEVGKFLDVGRDYQRVRDRLGTLMTKWADLLYLNNWEIIADYRAEADSEAPGLNGCALVQWPYKRATIKFHLVELLENTEEQLERLVLHELLHVVVNEMRTARFNRADLQHEERVVTELTGVIYRLAVETA